MTASPDGKTLLVMRHAKSDWSDDALPDRARPLNKRGERDAPRMGRLVRDEHLLPDLIATSPAERARKTAEAVATAAGYKGEIVVEYRFYPGEPDDYVEVLRRLPDTHRRVMVVGHNPGLQDLVERLTGRQVVLPTASLALIDLPVNSWSAMDRETRGQLTGVWRPRDL